MSPPTTSTADFVPATQPVSKEPMSLGLTFEETNEEKMLRERETQMGHLRKRGSDNLWVESSRPPVMTQLKKH